MANGYSKPAIKARRKYSKNQKLDFQWFNPDDERAEYWVRISAM